MLNFIKELGSETIVKIVLAATTIFFFFSEVAFKTSDALQPLINALG